MPRAQSPSGWLRACGVGYTPRRDGATRRAVSMKLVGNPEDPITGPHYAGGLSARGTLRRGSPAPEHCADEPFRPPRRIRVLAARVQTPGSSPRAVRPAYGRRAPRRAPGGPRCSADRIMAEAAAVCSLAWSDLKRGVPAQKRLSLLDPRGFLLIAWRARTLGTIRPRRVPRRNRGTPAMDAGDY